MWMKNSPSVVVDDTTAPEYPLMEAAVEIAHRAVEHGMISRIVFMSTLDREAGGIYHNETQIIRIGVRDCHTALPILICHEVAHAIDNWTGHSLSESVDVEVIEEPRELFAETYERAALDPKWVENHKEDVALLCHDMVENHSSLAKREMPSERRYSRSPNPNENRLDSEIILTSQKINSYMKPTLSCDSSIS